MGRLHDVFGALCFLLSLFLIYQEYRLYFRERPRHSFIGKPYSISMTGLSGFLFLLGVRCGAMCEGGSEEVAARAEWLPAVQVCIEPGLQEEAVLRAGYQTIYSFFSGFRTEEELEFVGWPKEGGKPRPMMSEFVTVRASSDIITAATFISYNNVELAASLEPARVLYPHGQCFYVRPPPDLQDVVR